MNVKDLLLVVAALALLVALLTTSVHSVWLALLALLARASVAVYGLVKQRHRA